MSILSTTNKRLIKVGQDYSAGENIGIYDRIISGKNWYPDIESASANAYNESTAYVNNWVEETYSTDKQSLTNDIEFVSGAVNSGVSACTAFTNYWINNTYVPDMEQKNNEVSQLSSDIDYISGVALTAHQSLTPVYNQIDYVSAGVDYVSAKALTAHQSLEGYLTKPSGDLYYQPIGDYATNTTVNNVSSLLNTNKLDVTSFSTVSGTFLTAHQDLSDYATNTKVDLQDQYLSGAIQYVSANAAADQNVNQAVYTNSSTWNEVTNKLDESAFQDVSGLFLTAIPQEYVVESDIPGFISAKLDTTAFSTVSGDFLTAHQDISYKLDTTAFEDVSGTFATNEALENTSGAITSLIPTDYYPDTNPSGFISGVDLTPYATNEDLQIVSGGVDYVSGELTAYALASQLPTNDQLLPYPMTFVATSGEATGTNILYVVTGTGE